MVLCPIVYLVLWTSLLLLPNKIQSLSSAQKTDVLISASAETPCFGWSGHVYCMVKSALCFFFVGSIAETENKFMIRSHFTAAAPGLSQWCELQLFLFYSIHNHWFCFLQVWCPVFASLGHRILLKFGLQDTLLYKVLKKNVQYCLTPSSREYQVSTSEPICFIFPSAASSTPHPYPPYSGLPAVFLLSSAIPPKH